jgi:hypothetical protein
MTKRVTVAEVPESTPEALERLVDRWYVPEAPGRR